MFKAFNNHIKNNLPFLKKGKLLIAISGGLDSVVLTHICAKLKLDISLAHCNFNLRGNESDADEHFVLNLAETLSLEVFIQNFDTEAYASEHKLSTQMAARELRYDWFHELSKQLGFDYILTAHHADDNLETFLINLSRGSGLEGLLGIPEVNDTIVRPLLLFSREDIEAFAKRNEFEWREDSSNSSVKYLRNKLRHEVLPILKGINPQLLQNFNKTVSHLKESQQIIDDRVDAVSDDIIDVTPTGIHLNIEKIMALNNPKAYLYELLKDYGFTEWNDVEALLDAQSGKQLFSNQWRLIKDRDTLILVDNTSKEQEKISVTNKDTHVMLAMGNLKFEVVTTLGEVNKNVVFLDKSKLNFPLIITNHSKGDIFYPLGMQGKKKISKYFKDEKLSLVEKENALVLYSGKYVVWIIGKRSDDRFKVTKDTKSILKVSLN